MQGALGDLDPSNTTLFIGGLSAAVCSLVGSSKLWPMHILCDVIASCSLLDSLAVCKQVSSF